MRYEIIFAPDADVPLYDMRAYDRAMILDEIERHLRYEPTKISKSRIKVLKGLQRPQYRLRIGDIRVFYDVSPGQVEILAVVPKSETAEWLSRWGIKEEGGLL